MDEEDVRALHAELAKSMAILCVRNTDLENVHAGVVPATLERRGRQSSTSPERAVWEVRNAAGPLPKR